MGARRRLAGIVIALMGLAAGTLPALAGSETTPTIEALSAGKGIYGEETFRWSPSSASVPVAGAVTLANPNEVKHGVYWYGGPATPSCSAGVPVGTTAADSGTHWSGTCTFAVAGTYSFYCTVHGPSMSAQVTVGASGTTTVTTTQAAPPSGTTGTPPPAGEGGLNGTSGSPAPASLLASPAATAITLSSAAHGHSIHGRLALSAAARGARLVVRALVHRHGRSLRVGRLSRTGLSAGPVTFTLRLSGAALRGLRAGHALAVSVELSLRSPGGTSLSVTRRVLVHR